MKWSKALTTNNTSIPNLFDHLYNVIRSPRFLNRQGLGNELPFFICPYSPTQALEIIQLQQQLEKQLDNNGVQVLSINLYDLSIDLLRRRGIWERILSTEQRMGKPELGELLRNVLDAEQHLAPAIADLIQKSDGYHVMFLSGVGEVYPYIRSHTVLNNLQSVAKDRPTVMFFPGTYTHSADTGASLNLFGRLRDDKYYRAFNILDYNV